MSGDRFRFYEDYSSIYHWFSTTTVSVLGCPMYMGGVWIQHFDDMVRKIRGRIYWWANWLLSFGGKLVLTQHVLSSMSLYFFHVLRPPATVV